MENMDFQAFPLEILIFVCDGVQKIVIKQT